MCECGNSYNGDYVPATGHDLNEWYNDDETCYSDGTKRVASMCCEDIHYTETVKGTMTSHRFSNYESNKNGTKTGYCIFGCGATDTVINNGKYDDFQYYVSDSEVTITKYIGSKTDVVIPAYIEGYPVVNLKGAIFSDAWYNRGLKISSLFIPESVEFIDDNTFEGCYYIEEITVDKNNKNFSNDEYNVLFNKDKTVLIKYTIGSSRENYKIPEGVVTIAEEAFMSCLGIKNITIPDSVRTINKFAFSSCPNLVNVSMGKNVEYIGLRGFEWCEKLEDVTFPETLKEICDEAFQFCDLLKNIVLPDSLTTLGMYAFQGCYSLERVVIGRGLKTISRMAFTGNINEVFVPSTVEKIEYSLGDYVTHLCYEGTKEQWDNIKFNFSTAEYIHFNYDADSAIINNYVKPTCSRLGERRTECVCGMIIGRELLMSEDHAYETYSSDDNATCTESGTKTAECIYGCGKKNTVIDEGSAKGHDFTDWINDELTGIATRTCKNCGYTETVPLINQGDCNVEIVAPQLPNIDFDIENLKGDAFILIEETITYNLGANWKLLKAFDITMKNKDGVHVQPNGTVKVKLPLDWEKNGVYKVYRINNDGTITDMDAYRQGSHMVFDTDHFSIYVIVEESEQVNTPTEKPIETNCSCNCHKGGIVGFFFKIINFFQKLFGMNKVCACGIAHY